MRKREIIWIAVLFLLGGIYVHFFTHWFEKRHIGINASFRPIRRMSGDVFPVFFTLNGDYELTSVQVIPFENDKFNPSIPPVWHLISDSNSAPTRVFRYGQTLKGMKPALKGVRPDPLTPDLVYRLILSTGDATGYTDFKTKAIGE
jgi:hypothetical protein